MESFEQQFLSQIYSSKELLKLALMNMMENIFNIYDYDGDGFLSIDEYITLISDLLYISVLMNRISHSEYTIDNVTKIATWSSSNFKENLFRQPNEKISHDLFIEGFFYAVTENRNLPVFPENNVHIISFLPELIHYFDYYKDVAKRRGWPQLIEDTENEIVDEIPEAIPEENTNPSTSEQQLLEYRERQKQKQQEKKENEEKERLRIINERQQQEDMIQRQRYEHQQRLEQEQREREQRNLEEENRERNRITQQQIIQQQLQQIQNLQNQFRAKLREERNNRQVNQFDDGIPPVLLESAGELHIDENEIGFDVIEGDTKVIDFINSNKNDNIVFKVGDSYFLASKERIKSMIQQGEKDNSLFYGCMCELEGPWNQPATWALLEQVVIPHTLYFNIQQLGVPIRYVELKEIEVVLNGDENYFLIEKPADFTLFPSFASDNVLNHGIGSMSGAHCNDGQMDVIYQIKVFSKK